MEWSALRDFVTVAQTGSLSAAARTLEASQPTIGRRIEQLEQQLNAKLFKRTTKGLNLTETGERILDYAKRMADEAVSIERIASGANQRLEGSIRVTLTDLMGNHWLPAKLPEFFTRYPGLRMEVAVDNRSYNLVRREADIAVRFGRPEQLDLVVRKSVRFHYGLYAAREYLDKHGYPKHHRDLKKYDLVSYDETLYRFPALKRMEKLFDPNRILARSTSNAGVMQSVIQGVGIAALPCYFSEYEPNLERILPDTFDSYFDAWVITHSDLYQSARIRAIFDFLVEKLEEDTDKFAGKHLAD